MNLATISTTAHGVLVKGKALAATPHWAFKAKVIPTLAKHPILVTNVKSFSIDFIGTWALAYGVDSFIFVANKAAAQAERDRRLERFLEAVQGKDLTPQEMELLAKSVPSLRKPTKGETFRAMTKRHINRAYRTAKITGWAYIGVYAGLATIPVVSAAAWGQYLGTKAVNVVMANRHVSPKMRLEGAEREVRALLRRRRMHSWVWRKTTGAAIKRIKNLYTPVIEKFYVDLPELDNGAIIRFDPDARVTVKEFFTTEDELLKGEKEPFSEPVNTEAVNDDHTVFSERQKITFDNEVNPAVVEKAREAAKAAGPKEMETVENWSLILEGAQGYNRVGFDRCQLAYEAAMKSLPDGIELDDPRRLGSAMATQVKMTKRSQLAQAREALPFWVICTLNELDPSKIDDPDANAAFIDFTDASGLQILQGWDDVVGSKKLATV